MRTKDADLFVTRRRGDWAWMVEPFTQRAHDFLAQHYEGQSNAWGNLRLDDAAEAVLAQRAADAGLVVWKSTRYLRAAATTACARGPSPS